MRAVAVPLLIVAASGLPAVGQEAPAPLPDTQRQPPTQFPNFRLKTMGGQQFWADVHVLHGWRIQRNVFSGHARLLDPNDVRHAWGSEAACRAKLRERQEALRLPPVRGQVVILLHGLGGHRTAIRELAGHVQKHGYTAVEFGYPSTRAGLETHARNLARVINGLGPEVEQIHFVAHSLGNLVVRRYLRETRRRNHPGPPVGRFVMLAPPNQGSAMARMFAHLHLYHLLISGTGEALASRDLDRVLGTPSCEFAILAGGKGDVRGWNPLLHGDDDSLVRVEETRLNGASDAMLLPVQHKAILRHPEAMRQTLQFLDTGRFEAVAGRPQMVPLR